MGWMGEMGGRYWLWWILVVVQPVEGGAGPKGIMEFKPELIIPIIAVGGSLAIPVF